MPLDWLENLLTARLCPTDETVKTCGSPAGRARNVTSGRSLPTDATTNDPRAIARSTASCSCGL